MAETYITRDTDTETRTPAFLRAMAEAGDDRDMQARLALGEVLWRHTGGDVTVMLVLMAEFAALLSASYGPDTAAVFRDAFDRAIPLAKDCIGPSVSDQPAGNA
jgi:hypothetical protein